MPCRRPKTTPKFKSAGNLSPTRTALETMSTLSTFASRTAMSVRPSPEHHQAAAGPELSIRSIPQPCTRNRRLRL